MSTLPVGSTFSCRECDVVMYRNTRELISGEFFSSSSLVYGNGKEVEYMAMIHCWSCGDTTNMNNRNIYMTANWKKANDSI